MKLFNKKISSVIIIIFSFVALVIMPFIFLMTQSGKTPTGDYKNSNLENSIIVNSTPTDEYSDIFLSDAYEQVENDISIEQPTYLQIDEIDKNSSIQATFFVNTENLVGDTEVMDIEISYNEIINEEITLDEDMKFSIDNLAFSTEYTLIMNYLLGDVSDPGSIWHYSDTKIVFTTPMEKASGEITIGPPEFNKEYMSATFFIDTSKLGGTTTVYETIIIVGNININNQTIVIDKDMKFTVNGLEYGVYYDLSVEYYLITETDKTRTQLQTMELTEFNVLNEDAPPPPENLKIESITKNGGQISWDKLEVDGQSIYYSVIVYNTEEKEVKTYDKINETTLSITGLKPNSNYTIKLWSNNGKQQSSYSDEINLTTLSRDQWIIYIIYILLILLLLIIIFGVAALIYFRKTVWKFYVINKK